VGVPSKFEEKDDYVGSGCTMLVRACTAGGGFTVFDGMVCGGKVYKVGFAIVKGIVINVMTVHFRRCFCD
jgi:hypothetical protein